MIEKVIYIVVTAVTREGRKDVLIFRLTHEFGYFPYRLFDTYIFL